MREPEFKAWLGQRRYRGKPLTTIPQRLNWCKAVERALPELGFAQTDLDVVYADGAWDDLLAALSKLRSNWRNNEAAARVIAPQSDNPGGQMSNARASVGVYGRFLAGDDPNYDAGVPGSKDDGDSLTDEEILERFNKKEAFKSWWSNWSDENRQAFLRVVRALHNGGLDWYHVNIDRQVRCGRKKKGAVDAHEVFVAISNIEPSCWVRREADRGALGLPESAVALSILAEKVEAAPEALQRFQGGTAYWPDELAADPAASPDKDGAASVGGAPTNLILYGPPGTGKTYATAAEAVRLCDGLAETHPLLTDPARRGELKQRYDNLIEARRIDFVTFHQSYSYEEFVEGLRPVQNASSDETGSSASGFSLQPEDGIFRRISQRAAASKGGGGRFEVGDRKLFKLSIGEAANPEDDYLFEEAIKEHHALLGYGDIDWTDARFEDRDEIIAACKNYDREHPDEDQRPPTPQAGRVQCPMIFRNWVRTGDLVIVSKGNLKFRAIGEITGDYQYVPRPSGVYSHRRKVDWLWVDPAGAPVDDILLGKNFSQRAIYELARGDVNIAALEGYIQSQLPGGGPAEPEPYVLIIDEINRGNISKIFGELITLIEPDKRAGMSNALEVRLPYSKTPFSVPSNLHLVGTMNTADRSIAQLDTALRRRFVFREIAPEPSLLPEAVDGVPLRSVLECMNDRIEYLVDREHRIGHAFFIGEGGADRDAIDRTMRDKVIPLLQEYFFEDWGRIAAVLGEPRGGGFLECRKIADPIGEGEDRTSWSVRSTFAPDAYDRLVSKTESAIAEAAE
jgi:5-methylcytosine-specific restriction protein B